METSGEGEHFLYAKYHVTCFIYYISLNLCNRLMQEVLLPHFTEEHIDVTSEEMCSKLTQLESHKARIFTLPQFMLITATLFCLSF